MAIKALHQWSTDDPVHSHGIRGKVEIRTGTGKMAARRDVCQQIKTFPRHLVCKFQHGL